MSDDVKSPEPSLKRVVRHKGFRIKLKNRRVLSTIGPDGNVWLKFVILDGKERRETMLKLTPEAASATAAVIIEALEMLRRKRMKEPNGPRER